ncbi:hypothetical protein [Massilia sp. METH4]|uniref:hypothetical protein n=1 Tax=Massilia sp. METH4 TaxID=3123041 RepID=UPI0030CBB6AC
MHVTLESVSSPESKRLIIDGTLFPISWGSESRGERITGGIEDDNRNPDYRFLMDCPIGDLTAQFQLLSLPYESDWCEEIDCVEVIDASWRASEPSISLPFRFEPEDWARPWSINQYTQEILAVTDAANYEGLVCYAEEDIVTNDFGFIWPIADLNGTVQDELDRWLPRIAELMNQVEARLRLKAGPNTLVNIFEFPPEIETACQQYLVYFGQFLADLGIEADIGLSHEAHRILFSVTPTDPDEALQTLRDALQAYLQLPSNAGLRQQLQTSSDIAAMQMNANILHLQSQLQLGAAVLEAKNQTIEALRVENYLLKQVPPPALPASPPAPAKPDTEPLVGKVVTVKDVEIKGVVVHLPELVRRLKRRFKRD